MKSTSTDPRAQRTRDMLRQALMQTVVDKPFRNLTIKDIATHACVNRATFYLHYEDKYDLLSDCANEIFSEIRRVMEPHLFFDPANLSASPSSDLERMKVVLIHIQNNSDFFRAMMRDDGETMFQSLFLETASRAMKVQVQAMFTHHKKEVNDDLLDMMIRFQSAGNFAVISWWLENDMRIPIDVMAERLALVTMPPLIHWLNDDAMILGDNS